VYEVLIERTAERDLRSLSSPLFLRIILHIRALAENPRRPERQSLLNPKFAIRNSFPSSRPPAVRSNPLCFTAI
jgi:mRNA-degrading endonuclease RelE of RelBE toxin-antitoxin system